MPNSVEELDPCLAVVSRHFKFRIYSHRVVILL